ncbi:MAG: aminoacyl-tRNA hydrolase [Oceanidesulfovibrio sp.]
MASAFSMLLAGLGNPGPKYEDTRHNFGFMLVDGLVGMLSQRASAGLAPVSAAKNKGDMWQAKPVAGKPAWLLLKPMTYMNLSGEAVAPVLRFYKMQPDQLLVAHDELDLPLGRMKLKFGGGSAGHNGLKSIAECLGTNEFHRLRLGVGRPAVGDAAGYVLSVFSEPEKRIVSEVLDSATKAIGTFARFGPQRAIEQVNSFRTAE